MNIKRELTIGGGLALFAFLLFVYKLIIYPTPQATPNALGASTQNSTNQATVITSAELSQHSTPTSCWVAVSGKVYDLTSFAQEHSGGAQAIYQDCGKDGTFDFQTRDGQGPHQGRASRILDQYYIGDLR